jgi:hypothetical protein
VVAGWWLTLDHTITMVFYLWCATYGKIEQGSDSELGSLGRG